MIFFVVFFFGIFALIFRSSALYIFYCSVMVIVFGFYIIFDTQLIIGNGQWKLSEEDYIVAALIIYIDIVQLFIYLLRILGESR